MSNPKHFQLYLVAFVLVSEGWSRTYEDTSKCYTGAAIPPGSDAWSQTRECRPGEFWVTCWQAPAPSSTSPPDGYRLSPVREGRRHTLSSDSCDPESRVKMTKTTVDIARVLLVSASLL